MSREQARAILGRQSKGMLRGMAKALCLHSWHNTKEDWQRLRALRALGYRVTVDIPS